MKKTRKYEDWFKKEAFSPVELALLMADTVPDRSLAKAMIKAIDPVNVEGIQSFRENFGVDQHSAYLEKFRRSLKHVTNYLVTHSAVDPKRDVSEISFREAVALVLDRNGIFGDDYGAFIRAALEAQVTPSTKELDAKPAWQTDLDLDQIIRDKADAHRERGLLYRGLPNKSNIAAELLDIINDNEAKRGRRRIGLQSVRNLLKNQKL